MKKVLIPLAAFALVAVCGVAIASHFSGIAHLVPLDFAWQDFTLPGIGMAGALAANTPRAYELGTRSELPVKGSTKIFEGSCVGVIAASGLAQPIATTNLFAGFAEFQADNSASAVDGAIMVRVITEGQIVLPVTGVTAASFRVPVYASDDGTFTTTAGSNVFVGYVKRVLSNGNAVVSFSALNSASPT